MRLGPVYALTPFGALRIDNVPRHVRRLRGGRGDGAGRPVGGPGGQRRRTCWLMRGLLGPGRLARRVADLEQSRALAVDDSAAMLRRLERDLHDGAQIRLATLAMNLGMAREKLGAADASRPGRSASWSTPPTRAPRTP